MLNHYRKRLIEQLLAQGISNSNVLEVMGATERHMFVDEALSSHAYTNNALPIGYGQTISQPYIVARMTEALLSQTNISKVLEIGTGCGYQTAILAQLVKKVYTVERIKPLLDKAEKRLQNLGLNNIVFSHNDGYLGWNKYRPYQGIIVTAAPTKIPETLLNQLSLGGCLIIPIGYKGKQSLLKIIRKHNSYEQYVLDQVSFVPLREGLH
jgi:protein-L-isoaspartate(D-aspartate) O-methyltransferase